MGSRWPEVLQPISAGRKLVQVLVTGQGALDIKEELGGTGYLLHIVIKNLTSNRGWHFSGFRDGIEYSHILKYPFGELANPGINPIISACLDEMMALFIRIKAVQGDKPIVHQFHMAPSL